MTHPRRILAFSTAVARLAVVMATLILPLTLTGCLSGSQTETPAAPGALVVVVGRLVAEKDDRPLDGGVDLTLETARGVRELVRVPSLFRVPPRDSVAAMHKVVDAAKIGDRLRARGMRDETGALRVEVLELIRR